MIYSREYIIADCDGATRAYFDEIEMPFGDAMDLPAYTYVTQVMH